MQCEKTMISKEFKFSSLNDASWVVYSKIHQSTDRRTLVLKREVPGSPGEITLVEEPKYPELFQQINDQKPGTYSFRELNLTQEEWCWLRGVIHCLMCSNANQVPIEAILVGDSKAL